MTRDAREAIAMALRLTRGKNGSVDRDISDLDPVVHPATRPEDSRVQKGSGQ